MAARLLYASRPDTPPFTAKGGEPVLPDKWVGCGAAWRAGVLTQPAREAARDAGLDDAVHRRQAHRDPRGQ
jgi:hypothetical protein